MKALLRRRWGDGWLVWRSRDDQGEPNSWCATRISPKAGLDATIIEPGPIQLDAALSDQKRQVAAGKKPYTIHSKWLNA